MGGQLAYNPDDPLQSAFLTALEGGASYSPNGANPYDFTASEWAQLSNQFGLSAGTSTDQSEGAWYLAEQTYSQNTGGASLESALQSGNFSGIQSALSSIWPSLQGSQSEPGGFDAALTADISSANNAATTSPKSAAAASSVGGGWLAQTGTFVLGGIIVAVTLWALLRDR